MTADLLREAATLMRRRAQMATESIDAVLDDILGDDATGLDGTWDEMVTSLRTLEGSPGGHIAAWRPAVALAVADILQHEADVEEQYGAEGSPLAVAVARAYLGRPA